MAKKEEHHVHHPHHSEHHVHHVHHTPPVEHREPRSIEERLVENLIELQKVHANLAEKYDKLANQIANLLTLFEMSARAFAKQIDMPSIEKDKEFLDKIDRLLDQNKTIAKGLTMMEEKMRERLYGSGTPSQPVARPMQAPIQRLPPQPFPIPSQQMTASVRIDETTPRQPKFQ